MKYFINRDGIIGPWYQWIIIGMAFWTIAGYTFFNISFFIRMMINHGVFTYNLDPHFLILLIPTGVLFGEMGYREDFKINAEKRLSDNGEG